MTERPETTPTPVPGPTPSTVPGSPVDDRRDDPPPPASATTDGQAETEAQREAQETVRSISRLEESN